MPDMEDEPMFAVTGDDARFYQWPPRPGIHLMSITTNIKKGVPNPILEEWKNGKTAARAVERIETLRELGEVERGALV